MASQPDYDYFPQNCVWELTLRCNMRCIHCGSSAGAERDRELTVRECLDVADQLLAMGCQQTTLIGGEVLLFKGWERVARRLWDGGCGVNIITNGLLVDDDQIGRMRRSGLGNVGVSIDGLEDNHNRIRNSKSAFARAIEAIKRLRRADISVGVVTALLNFNVDDLEPLYELLASLGVEIWQLQIANAMGNLAGKGDLLLEPAKVPQLTRFIAEKRVQGDMQIYAGDDIGYYDEYELALRSSPGALSSWQGCQAGLLVVGIDSVGNVKGCESLYDDRFIEGNLRQESLADIWSKEGAFAYNREFDANQLEGACKGCDKGALCRAGCKGLCHFATGSMFNNPFCCYPGRPNPDNGRAPRTAQS